MANAFKMMVIILLAQAAFYGCQQDQEWGFEGGGGNTGIFPYGGGNNGQAGGSGGFGNGDLNPVDLQNDLEREIEYPSLRYTGDGNVASIDSRNPTQIATTQEFSREQITLNTTRFTSSDSTIDKRVRKLVGNTTFIRTPKVELINREDSDGFNNLPFVMYASSSSAQSGYGNNTSTYSKPVPAAIIPTEMVQYNALLQGPVSYSATVLDDGGARFDIVSTLQDAGRTGAIIKVKQTTEIQGNHQDGRLYDKLHLAWTAVYEIDTANKRVISLSSNDYYHNEKKGLRNMTANLKLCSYTVRGQTQNFPCADY